MILVTISLPILLKRRITAMKWNSMLLVLGISTLLLTFLIKSFGENSASSDFDFKFENIVNSINVTITTYGFIINLFPITQGMKDSLKSNVIKAVSLALFFCFSTYIFLSVCVLQIYGSNTNINLFKNLVTDQSLLSYTVRSIFLVIFFSNIPFVFYPGKLSVINLIAEY